MSAVSRPAVIQRPGPGLLIRFLWFVFIGWWLGGLVSALAWFLVVTVIGLPLGLWIINRLPTVITLRAQEQTWHLDERGVLRQGRAQRPFLLRAVWFLLVGWWLSGVWLATAYVALVVIIGLPIAFWMYGRVGAITTLYRS
jgi:uncharacterized membrane protein YccF (DUF307 family)